MKPDDNDTASVSMFANAYNISPGKVQAAWNQSDGTGEDVIRILKENLRAKGDKSLSRPPYTKTAAAGYSPEAPKATDPVQNISGGITPSETQDAFLRLAGEKTIEDHLDDPLFDREKLEAKYEELKAKRLANTPKPNTWYKKNQEILPKI